MQNYFCLFIKLNNSLKFSHNYVMLRINFNRIAKAYKVLHV